MLPVGGESVACRFAFEGESGSRSLHLDATADCGEVHRTQALMCVRSDASTHLVGQTLSSACAWEQTNGSLGFLVPYSTRCPFIMEACSLRVEALIVDDLVAVIKHLTPFVTAHCAGPFQKNVIHTSKIQQRRAILRCETCQRQRQVDTTPVPGGAPCTCGRSMSPLRAPHFQGD